MDRDAHRIAEVRRSPGGEARLPDDSLICRTTDFDAARASIAAVFCPYTYDVSAGRRRSPITMHHTPGLRMSVSTLSYGAPIEIRPDTFGTFLLVTRTVSGTATIECGNRRFDGTGGMTAVISPEHPARLLYQENNTQSTIRIERDHLQAVCRQLFDVDVPRRPDFALRLDGPGLRHRWDSLVAYYVHLLREDLPAAARDAMLARAEELLLLTLVTEHDWACRDAVHGRPGAAMPAQIRRAIDYIDAYAAGPLTLQQIAAAAHCSLRSLQRGFATFKGTTPMQYARDARLRHVRARLLEPGPRDSVTDIAIAHGFLHLGEFATAYRKAFGESPSETLRRHR
ncbi:hypothetical protein WT56_27425 [Burkholderia pseudomultivorans]|uniref:HTH araC/xylS-type domain-containing protein n=2 Tax=Burkholderia pseudomultivorans TaxID=1207504 RepID=A0A132E928_9BURK|nr:hypothetical protein WT56_27425 [Burkholderia pseudomultivorans]